MVSNPGAWLTAVVGAVALTACGPSEPPQPSPTSQTSGTDATPVTAAMWTDYVPFAKQLQWPPLHRSAHPSTDPSFVLQRACGADSSGLTSDGDGSLPAAVSTVGTGPDWQAQQLIVLAPNTERAQQIFNTLRDQASQSCTAAANGARSAVSWDVGPWNRDPAVVHSAQTGAVVTGGPLGQLHDYLINTSCNDKQIVAELAVWASRPSRPWSLPDDPDTSSAIFDSMAGALCSTRTAPRQP